MLLLCAALRSAVLCCAVLTVEVARFLAALCGHGGLLLLVHLPCVDHLLQSASSDEAVDADVAALADPEGSVLCLQVVAGVPRRVDYHNPVRSTRNCIHISSS